MTSKAYSIKFYIPYQASDSAALSILHQSENCNTLDPIFHKIVVDLGRQIAFHVENASLKLKFEKGKLKLESSNADVIQIVKRTLEYLNPLPTKSEISELDLNITSFKAASEGGGQTTAPLRHLHLLQDIAKRYEEKRKSDAMKICIVGPGLMHEEGAQPSSPQFVELLGTCPNAGFLLLDYDPIAVEKLQTQFSRFKSASYDPFTLRWKSTYFPRNRDYAAPSYQPLLAEIKTNLSEKVIAPKNGRDMLQGKGTLSRIMVKVNPNQVEVREFNITSSEHQESDLNSFDVIVATLSILHTFNSPEENFHNFKKFLPWLCQGGSMYIDTGLYEYLGRREES